MIPQPQGDPGPQDLVENATDRSSPVAPLLTEQQERVIHEAACELVAAAVTRRAALLGDLTLDGAARLTVLGAFVSLKRRGRLRSCCGFFGAPTELFDALSQAARRTATEDPRLPRISPIELRYLDVEVWLLHSSRPVTAEGEGRVSEVIIGGHGLQIRRGTAQGLLLPGVATDHNLDAEAFLEQVCEKARIPPTAWKEADTQLFTFEGRAITGPFVHSIADATRATQHTFLTEAGVAQLVEHARRNIIALMRGALACCYSLDCPDGTAYGLSLTVQLPRNQAAPRFSKLSLRPGLPIQSTLYTLGEMAAQTLRSRGMDAADLAGIQVGLTVLWDPAMHGSVLDPDFHGFDPAQRALLAVEGGKSAWTYDPQKSASELLDVVSREAQVRNASAAWLFSFAALSTDATVLVAHVPRPQAGPKIRPPAVAGSFYPDHIDELWKMVDGLVSDAGKQREAWPAVMVPHAGLQYSGRIAAEVFKRVHIPEVVIVLGPRHRPTGMEWAVAPHDIWAIPGWTTDSDLQLARQLAEGVPDLHLDAVAHQQEHSIEVQLPLLARLAPRTRVIGIVVGAGDLERCRQFAKGLADVLRRWQSKPLLVVSSDLNHYASDRENRRLDAIALSALERLDAAEVYNTMVKHKISMCGLLPAVIALETLHQLGMLQTCQHVGYATSADVTGDTSRVVGYAGMLFG